ncbi:transposase [Flavobacteriaceae bacterium M23B6Z8]
MNKLRSSRQLELECSRNIELMWLSGNLKTSKS